MARLTLKILICVSMLCACAQFPKPEDRAFPPGTYHNKMTIEMRAEPPLELQGVVQTEDAEWHLTALSAAGTTLFRWHENLRDGTRQLENFQSAANEQQIRHLGLWLKRALFAPRSKDEFEFEGASFTLAKPDEKTIPRKIQIEHPRVRVTLEVVDYRLR